MGWTIPDKGEGDDDLQSIPFQEYLEVLQEGIQGINCVLSGLVVTGGADMTPAVAKGAVISNGVLFAVAAADVTIGAAHATYPRFDLIVVTSAGALAVRAGTAQATPKPPARTANDVVIAVVLVLANDTSIETTKITDMRVMRGRIVLKTTSAAVTNNTTSAIQTYFTVTLPSGLLVAGQQVRVTCGGNYLSNSGTGTWTLTIAYGGTTMYAAASAATAADADRKAWWVDFVLNASANNAQQLVGAVNFGTPGTITQATTGQGPFGLATANTQAIRGTAAVDSDAADRTLTVQWTMSVSNAAVETVMDFGVAELL